MTEEQLHALEGELDELIEAYRKVESVPLPNSFKQACSERWELLQDALEVSVVMAYSHDQQREDAMRVIPFGVALKLLSEHEESLVDRLTLSGSDLLFAKIRKLKLAAEWLAEHWDNLADIWEAIVDAAEKSWRFVVSAIPFLVHNLIATLSIPAFTLAALRTLEVRDNFAEKMRRRALPQRLVKRVYRRKIARL